MTDGQTIGAMHEAEESASAIPVAQQAVQLAQNGQWIEAVNLLNEPATAGQPWARSLRPWLRWQMKQGASLPESIDDIRFCAARGMTWVPGYWLQMLSQNGQTIPNSEALLRDLIAATQSAEWPWFWGTSTPANPYDLAWNALNQGQTKIAVTLYGLRPREGGLPDPENGWPAAISKIQDNLLASTQALQSMHDRIGAWNSDIVARSAEADKSLDELKTKAAAAGILINQYSNATTQALWDGEANTSAAEQRSAFRWGIVVLIGAAASAAIPLILHYLGQGPKLTSTSLLAAHASVSLALAALSGVLLARSRTRDHSRQRSRDLSTAMGTMITYANTIEDVIERQAFQTGMAKAILEAHLRADGGGPAGAPPSSDSLLPALLAAMRPGQGGS